MFPCIPSNSELIIDVDFETWVWRDLDDHPVHIRVSACDPIGQCQELYNSSTYIRTDDPGLFRWFIFLLVLVVVLSAAYYLFTRSRSQGR